jgi:hypothetical protein
MSELPEGFNAKETLYINRSESRCGSCNRGADPYEVIHKTAYGYPLGGCKVRYRFVSSDYFGMPLLNATIRDMRPDLIPVDIDVE